MRLAAVLVLAAAFVLHHAVPARALGWDEHHIVCALAWDELMPPVREKVEDILGAKGREAFALSCRWADDVKPWRKETPPWHYLNIPKGATTVDMERDCPKANSCVVEQIFRHMQLKGPAAKDNLRYLAHFIGDVHTPLHIGYAEDRGGDAIKGKFEGLDRSLHALWDYEMLYTVHETWQETARRLHGQLTESERKEWAAGTPVDWANESLAIILTPAVGYHSYGPQGFVLGEEYARANLPTLYMQMKKAGIRLAWVLTRQLQ